MNIYAQLVGDTAHIKPGDYAVSVTECLFTLITLGIVQATLIMQVRVVLASVDRMQRQVVLAVCGILVLVAMGFQMALTVANIKSILAFSYQYGFLALQQQAQILTMVSLSVFMAVFVAKLAVAMVQRRRLGQRQFGPMQVLFIMGCQTLIVPSK
jgi:pheromone alpha factor receptor